MSDLKHRTPEQLRNLIDWCQRTRNSNQEAWLQKEAVAQQLLDEAAELRKKYHNIGQKESWARYWLATKELEKNDE